MVCRKCGSSRALLKTRNAASSSHGKLCRVSGNRSRLAVDYWSPYSSDRGSIHHRDDGGDPLHEDLFVSWHFAVATAASAAKGWNVGRIAVAVPDRQRVRNIRGGPVVGELVPKTLGSVNLDRFEVCGDPGEKATAILKAFGAEIFAQSVGPNRASEKRAGPVLWISECVIESR
jgi:hypothetical protein